MRSTVQDVMTAGVVAVRKDASFKEMITRMRNAHISAFPVIDHAGKVVGVVSEADMLNKEADQATTPAVITSWTVLLIANHPLRVWPSSIGR